MIRPVTLILLAGVSTFLGGEAHRRTEQGNKAYTQGKNDAALESYQKAQSIIPEAPQLRYDLGNVLYRQENWAGAAEAYERALGAAGPELAPKAAYNLGNALFKDEKYDDAVKAYMRALKAAPQDGDAKHNLELALRALQEQKQKQQQQQQQQKQDQKKDQEQKPQGGGDEKQKPDDQKKGSSDEKKKGDKPQPQPKPGEMSKDEANKLLDRLNDEEKQNVKRQAAQATKPGERKPEKDW
ncbi:MAG TPA: tetratricopeptide repeat protein [Candidatus Polarisedimenticolaceae bacterium]|nr:tetratricopeptide repeat protein [Candidatus Polarisedimenticolaceae bacterium]